MPEILDRASPGCRPGRLLRRDPYNRDLLEAVDSGLPVVDDRERDGPSRRLQNA